MSSDFRCMWSYNKVRELDIRGIVHYEFVPTGQTVNQLYYMEVLKRLRAKVRGKRSELFCQQLMDLASRQCTSSHGTVCEGVFSY
jgi:hypothetical protein